MLPNDKAGATDSRPKTFVVSGVCCSTEENVMKKSLDSLLGAGMYSYNSVTCELRVDSSADEQEVIARVRQAGFDARGKQFRVAEIGFWKKHETAWYAGAATALTVVGLLLESEGASLSLSRGLLLCAIIVGGWKIFVKAWKSMRLRSLDMNVLMSIAVAGALAIGKWNEGAAVIILFAFSLMLESYSAARSRRAIGSLMRLSPEEAVVLRDGKEFAVAAGDVPVGSTIVIRPAERIPLDGVVAGGSSAVDESPITGESTPVKKTAGQAVYAGSINQRGRLTVNVTKGFEETTLARIIHLVEEAQHKRAPMQTMVDRFAAVYTPVMLVIAVLVALVPPLLLQQPLSEWFYRALVLLVIACPCALVISTPITIVSALTNAARHGILVKGGKHLETLAAVSAIAFDKTGTLTEGKPRVTDFVPLNSLSRDHTLRLIAAIEFRSEHHLASAVLAEASSASIPFDTVGVDAFEALPGLGVKATIAGTTYYLGNRTLGRTHGFCSATAEREIERLAREDKTVVLFGSEGTPVCILAMTDAARRHTRSAIHRLQRMGIRHLVMLSGDDWGTAERIAEEAGIEEFRGALMPEEKVAAVEEMKRRHGTVAMVGDGINDAPALAVSSVGIAMGVGGTDAALETADVVLMSDDLLRLPYVFGLSRKAVSVITQNIILAVTVKILFFILSFAGVATLWMAVLADDGAALAVILNGLRLLSFSDGEHHDPPPPGE